MCVSDETTNPTDYKLKKTMEKERERERYSSKNRSLTYRLENLEDNFEKKLVLLAADKAEVS